MNKFAKTRFVIAAAILLCDTSDACSIQAPDFVQLVPRDARPGEIGPGMPEIRVEGVMRGDAHEPRYSCSDIGIVSLSVADAAETAELSYELVVVEGRHESEIVPTRPLRPRAGENRRRYFVFSWLDGDTHRQEPLDLHVRVTALSASGVRGGSSVVRILDPGR